MGKSLKIKFFVDLVPRGQSCARRSGYTSMGAAQKSVAHILNGWDNGKYQSIQIVGPTGRVTKIR